MSIFPTLNPVFRLNPVRLTVIAVLAIVLVLIGFLFPFWIVLGTASLFVLTTAAVRAIRRASRKIDQILAEELPPNGVIK